MMIVNCITMAVMKKTRLPTRHVLRDGGSSPPPPPTTTTTTGETIEVLSVMGIVLCFSNLGDNNRVAVCLCGRWCNSVQGFGK